MEQRRSELQILEMLTELRESQLTHTVELKNMNHTLGKVDKALFGTGVNGEGLITKQAKLHQRVNLIVGIISFTLTTAFTIALTRWIA